MPSGLISTSFGSVSPSKMAAASLENGSALSPWNERVQSIFSSGAAASSRGLSDSPLLEMLSVVGRFGVGDLVWLRGGEIDVLFGLGVGTLLVPLLFAW